MHNFMLAITVTAAFFIGMVVSSYWPYHAHSHVINDLIDVTPVMIKGGCYCTPNAMKASTSSCEAPDYVCNCSENDPETMGKLEMIGKKLREFNR